jgi:hypothetical protein
MYTQVWRGFLTDYNAEPQYVAGVFVERLKSGKQWAWNWLQ